MKRTVFIFAFLGFGVPVLILSIFVFLIFIGNPFLLPYERSASSIQGLENSPGIIGKMFIKDINNWRELEIADKIDHAEKVRYLFKPGGGFGGSQVVKAEIELTEEIATREDLQVLFDKALVSSGRQLQAGVLSGRYCLKRNSSGYYKTDVLKIDTAPSYDCTYGSCDITWKFPTNKAELRLDYGDSWGCKEALGIQD